MMKKATRALTSRFIEKTIVKSKRSQEEMIGFALIIIIVAVILLVFLSLSLRQKTHEPIESYEASSFIQVVLDYTTEYESEPLPVKDLIKKCVKYNGGCETLEVELENILEKSWQLKQDGTMKGYNFKIVLEEEEIFKMQKGNETINYKSSIQSLPDKVDVVFDIYY